MAYSNFITFILVVLLHQTIYVKGLDERIVGGIAVKNQTEFNYQVSLRIHGYHFCGGTIYNNDTIITAAHCVHEEKSSNLEVVAGSLSLKWSNFNAQSRKVRKIIVHEEYNQNTIENDIAVLKLEKPFIFTKFVNSTPISKVANNYEEIRCTVSGWGHIYENSPSLSDTLRAVNLTKYSYSRCRSIYNHFTAGMFCAGDSLFPKDACQGDSGGPLVCQNKLVGIVSWGNGCGRVDQPGVYTNVAHYSTWITKNDSISLQSSFALILLINFVCVLNKRFL